MNPLNIPFQVSDWAAMPAVRQAGLQGFADVKTLDFGTLKIRLIEYSAGYEADHWCEKGHLIFCLEGSLEMKLNDGVSHFLKKGMSVEVSDGLSSHQAVSSGGAVLWIVDGDFLNPNFSK